MDNQVQTQKINKTELKNDLEKSISQIDGVNTLKEIKFDFNKDSNEMSFDVSLIVDFGMKIPDVAWNVQNVVIEIVTNYLKKAPKEVNIHVQGVKLKDKNV